MKTWVRLVHTMSEDDFCAATFGPNSGCLEFVWFLELKKIGDLSSFRSLFVGLHGCLVADMLDVGFPRL